MLPSLADIERIHSLTNFFIGARLSTSAYLSDQLCTLGLDNDTILASDDRLYALRVGLPASWALSMASELEQRLVSRSVVQPLWYLPCPHATCQFRRRSSSPLNTVDTSVVSWSQSDFHFSKIIRHTTSGYSSSLIYHHS